MEKEKNISYKILLLQETGLEPQINHEKKLKDYYKSNKNKLKFEGEYLNGKRWYGIVYNYEGKSIHPIVNGDGYFKEYNYNGKLIFEGEYKNGEKNGKGKTVL